MQNNMKENVLKVGDRIRVLKKPKMWSGLLNENYTLNLEFPYELTIKNIEGNNMTCGDYGWSLEYITIAGYELLSEEWLPKQGDKVLWSGVKSKDKIGIFICEYENYFIVKHIGDDYDLENGKLKYATKIKPYEDEIKVGDWVKTLESYI